MNYICYYTYICRCRRFHSLVESTWSLLEVKNLKLSLSCAMLYSVFISCILQSFYWSLIIWIHVFLGRPWGWSQGFKLLNKAGLAGAPLGSLHKCLNQLILLHLIFSDHFLHLDEEYTASFVILSYHLIFSILLMNWWCIISIWSDRLWVSVQSSQLYRNILSTWVWSNLIFVFVCR